MLVVYNESAHGLVVGSWRLQVWNSLHYTRLSIRSISLQVSKSYQFFHQVQSRFSPKKMEYLRADTLSAEKSRLGKSQGQNVYYNYGAYPIGNSGTRGLNGLLLVE